MQKFILITLILGLAFFLYLLQTEQINKNDFSIKKFKSDTDFEIRKQEDYNSSKKSDVYAIIKDKEYDLFTFSGNDFKKINKIDYNNPIYKVPLDALNALTITWIGNRYVFYITLKDDEETGTKTYQIYKTEYPTDDIGLLKYSLIKSIEDYDTSTPVEITY